MTEPSPTRLLLCRLGFVVLCLGPTLAVGGLIYQAAGEQAALDRDAWQLALTSRLGLAVQIDRLSRAGSAIRVEGLRLTDPETGQLVAQAAAADVEFREDAWHVHFWQSQIASGQLPALRRALEDRVLREADTALGEIHLSAADLTLAVGGQFQTLSDVACQVGYADGIGPGLQVEFQCPQAAANSRSPPTGSQRCLLHVSRNREIVPPATLWSLETGEGAMPCALLAELLPELSRLGVNCRFQGSAAVVQMPDGPRGQVAGILSGVDLDTLITEHFPHQLSGQATVRIDEARILGGKLAAARGSIQAERGSVSPSLLAAAEQHLGLNVAIDATSIQPGRAIPFGRLTLGFRLTDRALQLAGSADPHQPGVVLASATGALLSAPPNHGVPPVNLLRTLLPDNQYQVPATRQTDALVRLFPVPDIVPTQVATRPIHTPTRLRSSGPPDAAPVLRPPALPKFALYCSRREIA